MAKAAKELAVGLTGESCLTDKGNALHTTHMNSPLKGPKAMPNFVKLATDAGDQYLAALADSQEQFLKYVKAFSTWTPTAAHPGATAEDFFATPKEIFEANLAFTTKLLKQQKAFGEKLFAVASAS